MLTLSFLASVLYSGLSFSPISARASVLNQSGHSRHSVSLAALAAHIVTTGLIHPIVLAPMVRPLLTAVIATGPVNL
jgi:hypothetical protein